MSTANNGTTSPTAIKMTSKSAAAKDPSRPRRKKARRACHACQRAHLTCGDERPCQRCIKRGLADLCQDGVRKKAKYLHDAPIDTPSKESRPVHSSRQNSNPGIYTGDGTMNPLSMDQTPDLLTPNIASSEANINLGNMPQTPQNPQFNNAFFDSTDPSLYNFDISAFNFGSHYGALEFGMLGHIATGANATTPDSNGSGNYPQQTPISPSAGPAYLAFGDTGVMNDWNASRNNSTAGILASAASSHPTNNHAFTVTNGPGSGLTSPSPPLPSPKHPQTLYDINVPPSTASPPLPNFYSNANAPFPYENLISNAHRHQAQMLAPTLKPTHSVPPGRRPKDPSTLYTTVTKPYSYTSGFHRLLGVLRTRFSPAALNRIARAMASYRPSFIACTKTLKEEDLLFMEKCFQRTLWEYEKFIGQCGTPTIVCRRTGEVAAVGKEFCHLTSWPKDVLLGRAQNANINFGNGGDRDQAQQQFQTNFGQGQSQYNANDSHKPVFLAELLDQESVVEFYEQFAKLAFGDARGAVMTKCKLLKYQASEHIPNESQNEDLKRRKGRQPNPQMGKNGVVGESGLENLAKDGKVDCTFCWTVKRDMFDIPMLIVGNFLPILQAPIS